MEMKLSSWNSLGGLSWNMFNFRENVANESWLKLIFIFSLLCGRTEFVNIAEHFKNMPALRKISHHKQFCSLKNLWFLNILNVILYLI